jgi:hypothetical protein
MCKKYRKKKGDPVTLKAPTKEQLLAAGVKPKITDPSLKRSENLRELLESSAY